MLSSGDKDVSMLLLKESIAQCGAFKIELSGINEPIFPRRPRTPPSLFVRLNVFAAGFLARWGGGLPGSLVGTGNSQAAPLVGGREKSPFYPSLCVKVISSGNKKRTKKAEKVEVSVCERLLNARYSTEKRCVPSWETDPMKQRGIKEALQLNAAFFFVSVTIHLASANGIKVYPKRRVCIK